MLLFKKFSGTPPSSSSSSSNTNSAYRWHYSNKGRKTMYFTLSDPPEMVIECSSGDREVDLYVKWVEYALTKIEVYVIVDRSEASPDKKCRVVIGYRSPTGKHDQAQRAPNGDPLCKCGWPTSKTKSETDSESNEESYDASEKYLSKLYYKKVYEAGGIVDFGNLSKLNMKAKDFESDKY